MGAVRDRSDTGHRTRAGRRVARRVGSGVLVATVGVALLAAGPPAGARVDSGKRAGAAKGAAKRPDVPKRAGALTRASAAKLSRARISARPGNDLAQRVRAAANLRKIDLACIASFQFDFSPKLDNNTVTAQTTAALTGCLSPDGSHRNLLSAVLFADRGHSTATGCSPLPVAIDGVGSILWNDNSTSEFNFRVNTNPLAERFGLEANITGGTLAGGRITSLPLLLLQDGLCGLGGVNSLSANFGFDVFTHRPPLAAGR